MKTDFILRQKNKSGFIQWSMIGHSYNNGTYPDKTSYHHRRYQTAVKVVEYALKSLQDDI